MDNANIDLIRSHMDTIILRTLQEDDKYGLEILNEIKSLSDDLYTIKQPTLYSSLKRLESQGLILSYPGEETKGANRTYYRLTNDGRAFLEADQTQWEFARTIIDKLLSDKEYDKDQEKPFEPSDYRPLTKRTKKENDEKEVVIKYVEVEKPVYIDRTTGERLDDYSPDDAATASTTETEDAEDYVADQEIAAIDSADDSNFGVYSGSSGYQEGQTYYVKDEVLSTEIEQNSVDSIIAEDECSDDYNFYNTSSTQFTEDDYYCSDKTKFNYSTATKTPPVNHNNYIDDDVDYVGLIEGVLAEAVAKEQTKPAEPTIATDFDTEMTMTNLQQSLESKNIKMRIYQKANSVTYYSGKFYYSNKLLRDWSWITYAMFAVFMVLSYVFGKDCGVQFGYFIGFTLLGLALPIVCTIIWGKSPLRKKRNNLTLNNAMLSAIILMIGLLVLILIIAFFAIGISVTDPKEYVPALVIPTCSLALLPLAVVIYALLFKIKSYHLK